MEQNTYPTGRDYISFSEFKTWANCSWQHFLLYVMGKKKFEPNIYADFGTVVHDSAEDFLETKEMKIEDAVKRLKDIWKERGYPEVPEEERQYPDTPLKKRKYVTWEAPENWAPYSDPEYQYWEDNLRKILEEIPKWINKEFPEWEFVDAEHELNEPIEGYGLRFKGYIDAIIKVPPKRGKNDIYWILDWKTSGPRGWDKSKRTDFFLKMQIILYKYFWSKKTGTPIKNVRCGYVILRRDSKRKTAGLFTVSAGPKTIEKAKKWVRSMIKMVSEERALKNHYNCMFCEFKGTPDCGINR